MMLGILSWKVSRLALVVPLLAAMAFTSATGMLTPKTAEALDNEEQAFLSTINTYRAQNGLGPLEENNTLDGVAQWMANDMGTHNYFSHTDSLGRDPFARMDQMGYDYNTWRGENLVAGTETSAYAFQMWHDSPPHNENMLGEHYTVIGIARVYVAGSTYGWYWATEFGGQGAATPPPPPPPAVTPPPAPEPVTPAPAPVPAPTQVTLTTPAPQPPQAPTISPTPVPTLVVHVPEFAWWHTLDAVVSAGIFTREVRNVAPSMEAVPGEDIFRYFVA